MRIVSGQFRGRQIEAPIGQTTRPTSDRARQALFNILDHAGWMPPWGDIQVADLFAGSGALGFEALSRGAQSCLFVDQDREACACLRRTHKALNLKARVHIAETRIHQLGDTGRLWLSRADLIFMDPPYGHGLIPATLKDLSGKALIRDTAIIVVETEADEPRFHMGLWHEIDTRIYGKARISILSKKIFDN